MEFTNAKEDFQIENFISFILISGWKYGHANLNLNDCCSDDSELYLHAFTLLGARKNKL